jgi:hypothetical protein
VTLRVEVVYELTSLREAGAHHLKHFAEGYIEYLQSWQDAIGILSVGIAGLSAGRSRGLTERPRSASLGWR